MSEVMQLAQHFLKKPRASGSTDIGAICPFHRKADGSEEKDGSFYISKVTGLWYCHACHEKGNLFKFLKLMGLDASAIDFRYKFLIEELEKNKAPRPDPLRPGPITNVNVPLEESWLGLFDNCPVDLVEKDGFPETLLQQFDIGFDEKNRRITFPLRDAKGTLIGISGRAVDPGQKPRYKIYDTEYRIWGLDARITERRRLVWNAHRALQGLHDQDPDDRYILVVEGFKALLRAVQAGLTNVVALLGSYMSEEQQWVLERTGAPIYIMFDNNEAGWKGTLTTCRTLIRTRDVKIVPYPDEREQPSDLTPDEVCDAFFAAENFASWYIRQHSLLLS